MDGATVMLAMAMEGAREMEGAMAMDGVTAAVAIDSTTATAMYCTMAT